MTPLRPPASSPQGMGPCSAPARSPGAPEPSKSHPMGAGQPASPQGVTPTTTVKERPTVAARAADHDARRSPQRLLARPPTDASGPRRVPSGWLRDSVGDATVAPPELARAAYRSTAPGASDDAGDPTALAYQVAESFLDEGRRGMQRWMKPLAAGAGLDLSQLARGIAGLPNLEMLSRLASDGALQLGRLATDRTPRIPGPPIAAAPPASPTDSHRRRSANDPSARPRDAPDAKGDDGDGDGRSERPRRATEASTPQAPRRNVISRTPLPPADAKQRQVAWGEIVKIR